MQRFYLENLNTTIFNITLENKELIHQLSRVLRSKIWDKIILFDWEDDFDYIFEIKDILKTKINLEQVDRIQKKSEIDFELNLFQAIPNKMDKIESIIKNGTQTWISNFLFFRADRSQKLVVSDKKIERLKKIIIEAVEQSWRNKIPWLIIWEKPNFINLEWQNIFLHTKNNDSKYLKDIEINSWEKINLFVWPEWGFSDDEIWKFWRNDFISLYLWERILRTELAWISVGFCLVQKYI
jgi:16S rRNA (uracil1498-N3)-methyltransferase